MARLDQWLREALYGAVTGRSILDGRSLQVSASHFVTGSIVRCKVMINRSQVRVGTPAFPRIVRSSTINIVRVFRIETVLELFGLFKVKLFFMLEAHENELRAKRI